MTANVQEFFGQIDIYVFDQILRGNIAPGMRILDAGCGYGRNLVYLLREGTEIFAIDQNPGAVEHIRRLSKSLNTALHDENFQVSLVEKMKFPGDFADVVLCSSVLHFARDETHFHAMLAELWRVLRPGGLLFCRLGSRIGMDFVPSKQRFIRNARRPKLVPRGRTKTPRPNRRNERHPRRSPQNHHRQRPTLHDHLGP